MAAEVEEVRGRDVVIRFEARKCIHSRNCVLGRPDVFVPNVEGEWIHPDRATPEEVAPGSHSRARRARSPTNGSMAGPASRRCL